ncbi:GNAT family N-acetyltransferase [Streptomyces sp. P38-E01]|uniref:GNAT family N-acetyltransferase n=2 Tax=Streptomyces tardus TaxID=2780544 RepID=A0A949NAF7_9ACTN|nr:GNAT family N-acetyltransferase [Streptomyces tardus]MBU7599838.1 GNAT family N-acetyltransferase [Streptomyces tardus]
MRVTLCRDPDGLAALAPEWARLHRACGTATPFQSHAWLHSWWLSYGVPNRLRVVLVREGDRLVGAAPLMLTHQPYPVLVPLGGGISDFFDVLLDDDRAGPAGRALTRGLERLARTALLDLREVRPHAAVERVHREWDGPTRRRADSVCLELPGAPLPELLQRLPGRNARRFRAKLRRLEALGIEERTVPPHEVAGAVGTMLRLHGMQWRGRGVTPEHLRPRFAEHLVRATSQMVRSGDAVLTEFRLGGRVVAGDVTLLSAELAGGYLYGAHPELREQKVDITTMLLRHDARQVTESGRRVLSMLRGTEPYKQHWRPERVVNQRLLLSGRTTAPALLVHLARLDARDRLADAVRDRLPELRRRAERLRAAVPWSAGGTG